jgi:hypothetical protein
MTDGTRTSVIARNQMGGPTIITSDPKSTYEVVFGGHGAPDGTDYQLIPREIIQTPQFEASLAKGILAVVEGEDDADVQAALAGQKAAFWERARRQDTAAREVLEAPSDNDMLALECIGPGTRADAACGIQVPVRAREAGLKAPLCSQHASLEDRCVKRGSGPWVLEG